MLFLYSNEDRRFSAFGAVWSSNGIGIRRSGCEGDSHRAHLDDRAIHLCQSRMMVALDVRSTNESIRQALKYRLSSRALKDR